MTVPTATARISADEFLSHDLPIGSELIDGVVHVEIGPGEQLTSLLLADFALPIDELFAE